MIIPRLSWFSTACLLVAVYCTSCTQEQQQPQPQATPRRIISVVPSATEMLFAFGAGERVIAVGDYDHFPPEVNAKERIGGLLNPNIEKIIELKPDLVIAYGSQDVLGERLEGLGIRLHPFTHGNVEHTLRYMLELGRTLQVEDAAQEVVTGIRKSFEELRAQAPAVRPKVMLLHNREAGTLGSVYSIGSQAFQHDLIAIAGGDNIFGDVDKEVLQPSLEEIISRAPDVIIETMPAPLDEEQARERKNDWSKLPLPAVLNDRVYVVAEDSLLVPGPRLGVAARRLGEIIRNSGDRLRILHFRNSESVPGIPR